MATIPDLWSDDIKVDVVTPLAILRAQVGPIHRKTEGLLQAEVTTTTSDAGWVRLQLDLIAPVLNGYRHRLLAATHEKDRVYPVNVEAECFKPKPSADELRRITALTQCVQTSSVRRELSALSEPKNDWCPKAQTVQEFIELVSQVLHSGEVRSIIQSSSHAVTNAGTGHRLPRRLSPKRRRKEQVEIGGRKNVLRSISAQTTSSPLLLEVLSCPSSA